MNDNVMQLADTFARTCTHNKYIVDPKLNVVECGICGKELNPMWVLTQLCNLEGRAWNRLKSLEDQAEKAKLKNRCKCERCSQLTRIQR